MGIDLHVETEVGGQIDNGILTNVGPRLRTTGATGYELGDVPEVGQTAAMETMVAILTESFSKTSGTTGSW